MAYFKVFVKEFSAFGLKFDKKSCKIAYYLNFVESFWFETKFAIFVKKLDQITAIRSLNWSRMKPVHLPNFCSENWSIITSNLTNFMPNLHVLIQEKRKMAENFQFREKLQDLAPHHMLDFIWIICSSNCKISRQFEKIPLHLPIFPLISLVVHLSSQNFLWSFNAIQNYHLQFNRVLHSNTMELIYRIISVNLCTLIWIEIDLFERFVGNDDEISSSAHK